MAADLTEEEVEASGEDHASPTAPHTEPFLVEFCTCSLESLVELRTSPPLTADDLEDAATDPDPRRAVLEEFPPLP